MRAIWLIVVITISATSMASAQTPQPNVITVRESDSLLNGALIGAAAGVGSQLFFCTLMEPWEICRDDFSSMAKFGAIGTGIGMGIDALFGRKVYKTASGETEVHASPFMGRRAKGLRLSVRF